MKKYVLVILFAGIIAGNLFSQQFRLTGQWAIQAEIVHGTQIGLVNVSESSSGTSTVW